MTRKKGFILPFWNKIFGLLSYLSIFSLIRFLFKGTRKSYVFVELWVIFNLLFALFGSLIIINNRSKLLSYVILIYGSLRIVEVIVYQLNVAIFTPYRKSLKGETASINSSTRMVVLLIHNYVEMIFWYASLYVSMQVISNHQIVYSWGEYLKSSALCFMTFDTSLEVLIPNMEFLSQVVFSEVIAGMIMTVISIARFLGMLPEIKEAN